MARSDYARAASLDEATKLLSEAGGTGKALAGSESLGPMLNLRIAEPELFGGRHLDSRADDRCGTPRPCRHRRGALPTPTLKMAASQSVFGTVELCGRRHCVPRRAKPRDCRRKSGARRSGGGLGIGDPAARRRTVTQSPRGNRSIAADRLMVSSFVTTLAADELIRAIRVPKVSARSRWGFCKFNQKVGEFAHCIGGILYDPDNRRYRAVIGAIETVPIVIADATELFSGPFGPEIRQTSGHQGLARPGR